MRPETEAQLSQAVRDADGPLRIIGGGTRAPVGAGARLETGGLSGVTLYEPAALTLVVRAGTPLAEVQHVLAAEGQRLPFEPPLWPVAAGDSTIGGVVATNAAGPRRVLAGACRDSLIGVRFVNGEGAIIKNGGRVMKNVTGYDLVKLLAGSWGRLGVLSEVAFKVVPMAPVTATLRIAGDLEHGLAAMTSALTGPFDVTGAAWVDGAALIRIEGLAGSVSCRLDKLKARLERFGPVDETDPAIWSAIAGAGALTGPGDLWRFSVKPSEAPGIAARLGVRVVLDWGGGLIWARLPEGADARALARPYSGHATRLTGAGAPEFEPEPKPVAALSAAIRARFDPRDILNGAA